MARVMEDRAAPSAVALDSAVIVSSDTHIGPLLKEQLRAYCPGDHLERFDEFVAQHEEARAAMLQRFVPGDAPPAADEDGAAPFTRNWATEGHHDRTARVRDLDYDGIAAEVIFFGSQNGEPFPFMSFGGFFGAEDADRDLMATGQRIYNRWLADFVSEQPERHVGLAHLPMWDVDAAVAELRWAREAGLRAVNFPAPRPGVVEYNDRSWEPFWSACEDLGMTLTTHAGAGDPASWTGVESTALLSLESGGWPSRRGLIRMIFGGVFERHPGLKLVLTEQPGDWWPYTLNEMDSAYLAQHALLRGQVPRRPSEYCMTNVYIGASFLSPSEAAAAVRDGYADRVLWGSDYPHMEGTYQYPEDGDFTAEPMTHQALRFTFAGIPLEHVRAMVGTNAIEAYGLDAAALAEVARGIGAPRYEDLAVPIDGVPAGHGKLSFRQFGPWY